MLIVAPPLVVGVHLVVSNELVLKSSLNRDASLHVNTAAIVQVFRQALLGPGVGITSSALGLLLGTDGATGSVPTCCSRIAVIIATIARSNNATTPKTSKILFFFFF